MRERERDPILSVSAALPALFFPLLGESRKAASCSPGLSCSEQAEQTGKPLVHALLGPRCSCSSLCGGRERAAAHAQMSRSRNGLNGATMKRKYVARCSIAFLLLLLQADVIDSRGSRGRSRSSSSKSPSSSSWSQFGSSSSDSISSSSDSSNSDSSFGNGPERRRWESSKSEGSSTNYLQPKQELFPSKYRPQNPGYSSLNPWDSYDSKPWRPKPPKAKLKHGGSMSNMEFYFWDHEEEQWWYEHRNNYPDMVYFQNYDQDPVPEEVFVRECVNVTVGEFIDNRTDELEIKVVTLVVRDMCKEEYRERFFQRFRESDSGKIPKMRNTAEAVIVCIEGPNGGHDRVVALHISFLMMLLFLTKLLCY